MFNLDLTVQGSPCGWHPTEMLSCWTYRLMMYLRYISLLQVEKMLKDPEALENIVAASPGLDNDPIAMGKFFEG